MTVTTSVTTPAAAVPGETDAGLLSPVRAGDGVA
jgi:hypothetical protein